MPRYHVHFASDHREPMPPIAELASIEADDPPSAVEAMLAAGRYPQVAGLRWARVVVGLHSDGSPRFLARFPIHLAEKGAAIDWTLPGSEF